MQKEMSQFFQICEKPYLLVKFKDNEVVSTFCRIITDKFITFPKYEIEDLKFHGFPNDEYQEARWKKFPETLEKIIKGDTQDKIKLIREFLEECHGDDSTRDNENNVHKPEYLYYHKLFTKSTCIPLNIIYKVYPELKKENEQNELGYYIPTGTIIELANSNGVLKFNDVQDSKISLDFLKLPFRKSFTAKLVIAPRWFKYDLNYYRNRNAKWQELRVQGMTVNDIKIYILDCSAGTDWLKKHFKSIGIKTLVLKPVEINNNRDLKEALITCYQKNYRAVLVNNDIYVAKKTTAKIFKLDSDIPSNSYPWDLIKFNIHYSLIPETML